ncbi:MAG: formylglycine-generating enzyme family protein [Candidatus Brocadiia bacterium]
MRMIVMIALFLVSIGVCLWLTLPTTSLFPDIDIIGSAPIPLVAIAPGSFMMGSENGEYDEKPVHKVTLTDAFYIGRTEVTQAQYRAVMKEYRGRGDRDDLPVEFVSWFDAVEFCYRLTITERAEQRLPAYMEYRLPTEAEWEYCCRAGSTTEYCFGDDPKLLGEYAWFGEETGKGPYPVGMKKPNAWGLYDMHGNVFEWCLGWPGAYPATEAVPNFIADHSTDPTGPWPGYSCQSRGGTCSQEAKSCRSANRDAANYG